MIMSEESKSFEWLIIFKRWIFGAQTRVPSAYEKSTLDATSVSGEKEGLDESLMISASLINSHSNITMTPEWADALIWNTFRNRHPYDFPANLSRSHYQAWLENPNLYQNQTDENAHVKSISHGGASRRTKPVKIFFNNYFTGLYYQADFPAYVECTSVDDDREDDKMDACAFLPGPVLDVLIRANLIDLEKNHINRAKLSEPTMSTGEGAPHKKERIELENADPEERLMSKGNHLIQHPVIIQN